MKLFKALLKLEYFMLILIIKQRQNFVLRLNFKHILTVCFYEFSDVYCIIEVGK